MDYRSWVLRRKCDVACKGYDDHEFKELKDGRIVKIISCHHCFRIKERIYYVKQKGKRK